MKIEHAIQKAVEGGWKDDLRYKTQYPEVKKGSGDVLIWYVDSVNHEWTFDRLSFQQICLDPSFWQCLGKAMGWKEDTYGVVSETHPGLLVSRTYRLETWRDHWHRLIDTLAEGKTIESYFEEL